MRRREPALRQDFHQAGMQIENVKSKCRIVRILCRVTRWRNQFFHALQFHWDFNFVRAGREREQGPRTRRLAP